LRNSPFFVLVRSLVTSEDGQDLVEYALLAGVIAVAFAVGFSPLRTKMATAYQNWIAGAESIWIPPPPS
jgi:Flp pilus assembly pilin Flp